ncbi:hypothetical protein C8Q76DRAFT_814956 [Earliella scabrosa]|nr:hypothetical protein C8Q76DRAFT_814956 [Earliella scabrosa]
MHKNWRVLKLDDWLRLCLPEGDDPPPTLTFNKYKLNLSGSEASMYYGLAEGFNDAMRTIGCTDYQVRITAKHPDPSSPRASARKVACRRLLNPDLVIVPTTEGAEAQIGSSRKTKKAEDVRFDGLGPVSATPQPSGQPSRVARSTTAPNRNVSAITSEVPWCAKFVERMNWGLVEIPIEVTDLKAKSPFTNVDVEDVVSQGRGHVQARNRLEMYALEVMSRQHRTHMYTVTICRDEARFQRYDRAGCVVSDSFNYLEDPRPIGIFLYKLFRDNCVSRESRGHDPTAELASGDEAHVFRDVVKTHGDNMEDHVKVMFAKAAMEGSPIHKLKITAPWSPDGKRAVRRGDPERVCSILVGRPWRSTSSLTGTGTKGFVGWHEDRYPVFVKDYWRPMSDTCTPEFEHYHTLWRSSDATDIAQTFVPTLLGGGDVDAVAVIQRTWAEEATARAIGTDSHSVPRVHARLVIKEICRDLETFEDSRELVIGVYGALIAHKRAYDTFNILHRDLSVGNILLYKHTWKGRTMTVGLLSDWDLAKTREQLEESEPAQRDRSGTWRFMSALLQQIPGKRHEVSDDLESAFHIFRWCAIKYFPHTDCSSASMIEEMLRQFDWYAANEKPVPRGSLAKFKNVVEARPIYGLHRKHPFTKMLFQLGTLFSDHYEKLGLRPTFVSAEEADIEVDSETDVEEELYHRTRRDANRDVYATIEQHVASFTAPSATGDTSPYFVLPDTIGPTPQTSGVFTHDTFLAIVHEALFGPKSKPLWKRMEIPKNNSEALTSRMDSTGTEGATHTTPRRYTRSKTDDVPLHLRYFSLRDSLTPPPDEDSTSMYKY